jgi:DNA polymerase III epsilon subunit family exonuclease
MFISLDLETTGLDKRKDRIIEFGATKFSLDPKKKTETLQFFVNPGVKIPEFITHITNINDEDVKDAPPLEEVADQIKEFVGDFPIIGHFISFDVDFLKANNINLKNPLHDTAEIARIFLPGLPSYSLEILSTILGLKHEEKHRALDDCIAAQELLTKLIEQIESLPKELFEEIQKLCAKSCWYFADVIQTLEHKPSKTSIKKPELPPTEPLSPEEKQASEVLEKETKSSLIELFNPTETLVEHLLKTLKGKTRILVPYNTFRSLKTDKKIGLIENYVSTERLKIFKQKKSFNQPETTALIKTMIWLKDTPNGLTTEGLLLSPDERSILKHIQADLENINLETEPFVQKALELSQKEDVVISEHSYIPGADTKNLIILDAKEFIKTLQFKHGETISFKQAIEPIQSLITLLENTQTLEEIKTRLEILFGIAESLLNSQPSNPYFPQPFEVTHLDTSGSNWQKAKDISQDLINTSQTLAEIVTKDTLPYLKHWKDILRTLNNIFTDPDLDNSHIWIQKSYSDEIVIRKIPISLTEHFKKLKNNAKHFHIVGKSLDSADNAKLIRDLLGISDETPLHKIKADPKILKESQIFIAEDITGNANENFKQTVNFVESFLLKEKGQTIIIMNSMMKLQQIQLILAPKLKKEGITLLAQKGSGGIGKILELYKSDPQNTSILLNPNGWEHFDFPSDTTKPKNFIIHKVPFDPPSDQYISALSKNFPDPWNELQIPTAVLSLKKMVGKFISTSPGKTIILDNRLIEKSYAKPFIFALEDFCKPEQATLKQLLSL